jgi:hypothetical protein
MDDVLRSSETRLALTRPKIRTQGLHLGFANLEPFPAASGDSQN